MNIGGILSRRGAIADSGAQALSKPVVAGFKGAMVMLLNTGVNSPESTFGDVVTTENVGYYAHQTGLGDMVTTENIGYSAVPSSSGYLLVEEDVTS